MIDEKYLESIKKLRLMDDDFLMACLDGREDLTAEILRPIIGNETLEVKSLVVQREIKNLRGHSVKLDVEAVDADGKRYDIEVQRADKGAVIQRARYYSAMLDSTMLSKGEDYAKLNESYIIFITEHDYWGMDKPLYIIERKIKDTDVWVEDGSHIIYVNGAYEYKDGDDDVAIAIGKLMYDFRCHSYEGMNNTKLAKRVEYFKESKEGVEHMCKLFEDYGIDMKAEGKLEVLIDLYHDGALTLEQVLERTALTEDEFLKLAESK